MIFVILCFICCILCTVTNYIIMSKVKSICSLFDEMKFSFSPDSDIPYMKVDDDL